jgi:hypothetical protein
VQNKITFYKSAVFTAKPVNRSWRLCSVASSPKKLIIMMIIECVALNFFPNFFWYKRFRFSKQETEMFYQTELGFRSNEQIISNEIEITSCFTSRSTIFKFQTKWASRAFWFVAIHDSFFLQSASFSNLRKPKNYLYWTMCPIKTSMIRRFEQ